MHANTATLLRQSLTGDPAEFAETLKRMFDGHDVIADSREGQAFRLSQPGPHGLVARPSQVRSEACLSYEIEQSACHFLPG
jgi:hypothetical protein